MITRLTLSLPIENVVHAHTSWRLVVAQVALVTATSACVPGVPAAAGTLAARPALRGSAGTASLATLPAIPNQPAEVIVVPFVATNNPTKIVLPGAIDGRQGIFVLDLGCPMLMLNRTFLQPNPSGGVDTVTDATRRSDSVVEGEQNTWEKVHVALRIGTQPVQFDDPILKIIPGKRIGPGSYNAVLTHELSNFNAPGLAGYGPSGRLGNIGLTVLEPFETILDYTH